MLEPREVGSLLSFGKVTMGISARALVTVVTLAQANPLDAGTGAIEGWDVLHALGSKGRPILLGNNEVLVPRWVGLLAKFARAGSLVRLALFGGRTIFSVVTGKVVDCRLVAPLFDGKGCLVELVMELGDVDGECAVQDAIKHVGEV